MTFNPSLPIWATLSVSVFSLSCWAALGSPQTQPSQLMANDHLSVSDMIDGSNYLSAFYHATALESGLNGESVVKELIDEHNVTQEEKDRAFLNFVFSREMLRVKPPPFLRELHESELALMDASLELLDPHCSNFQQARLRVRRAIERSEEAYDNPDVDLCFDYHEALTDELAWMDKRVSFGHIKTFVDARRFKTPDNLVFSKMLDVAEVKAVAQARWEGDQLFVDVDARLPDFKDRVKAVWRANLVSKTLEPQNGAAKLVATVAIRNGLSPSTPVRRNHQR